MHTTRESINGIAAVVSTFEASTEQGPIAGYVGWLPYRGATYQIVTYTAASAFPRYSDVLQRIVASFGPLTDPKLLSVTPMRMDIVRIERRLNLGEFMRVHPSVVPENVVAVLNQVSDPKAVLEAGTLHKRVVRGGN